MWETLKTWDRELLIFLNNLGIEQFDSFWIFVTHIESWIALFVFFIVLIFYYYKARKGALVFLFTLITFGLVMGASVWVKNYVQRIRPNNEAALSEFLRILQLPTDYSFFSGHASSSFVITTFLVLALRKFNKWIYLAFLWPLLFSSSRIYVGAHYPSDILVGAFIGAMMAFIGYWGLKRLLPK